MRPPEPPAAARTIRILGVDPGSIRTGFGVIESTGSRLRLIRCGAIAPTPGVSLPERLTHIFSALEDVIADTAPVEIAVEGLFQHKNARSALLLGHARGVVLLAAARHCLAIFEYAPQEVKKALVGTGRAEKQQVQAMVRVLLALEQVVRPLDASDAVAIAICHASSRRLRALAAAGTAPLPRA